MPMIRTEETPRTAFPCLGFARLWHFRSCFSKRHLHTGCSLHSDMHSSAEASNAEFAGVEFDAEQRAFAL